MAVEDTLAMLKQMRWREAKLATGGEKDKSTDQLIRLHAAIQAIEAAVAEGEPKQAFDVDIDGMTLDPSHAWYSQSSGQR